MNKDLLGIVVNNNDPEKLGRCRIRVFGIFDAKDSSDNYFIPDDKLPWAIPNNLQSTSTISGNSSFTPPKQGSIVCVDFIENDIYSVRYYSSPYLSEELIEYVGEDYPNFSSIVYNTTDNGVFKIVWTPSKGLSIEMESSFINIEQTGKIVIKTSNEDKIEIDNEGSINIEAKDNINIIAAKDIKFGKNAAQALIKGNAFREYFNTHTHSTAMGPSGPPITIMADSLLSDLSKTE